MFTKYVARCQASFPRQRGVSLVELIMFIVIVSVAVIGIVNVMNLTASMSADPVKHKQALAIAETLLEEVQMAHFTFCDGLDGQGENALSAVVGADGVGCSAGLLEAVGQEAGGVGRPFDNVNDYVSAFGAATAAFQNGTFLADANGSALPAGFTATVTLTPTDTLGGIVSGSASAAMEVLRITVIVSYDNKSLTLDGYRTRYAPRSMP
jgi:MSHA pilin protein MshD